MTVYTAEDTRKNMGIRCYRKMNHWYWSIKPAEESTETCANKKSKDVRHE